MAQEDAIDCTVLDGLLETVGGDTEFLAELIGTFFEDAPVQIAAMQGALAAGRPQDLRRAAHSMKSNSASFGATTLSQMCKELEEMGKVGLLDGADERLRHIAAEFQKVRATLEALPGSM
jgi:HPt (histidine-containing phosphotransfer) domain-containing protein